VLDLYVLFNSRLFIHRSEFWNYVERLIFFILCPMVHILNTIR
jgi:hypothetical protein